MCRARGAPVGTRLPLWLMPHCPCPSIQYTRISQYTPFRPLWANCAQNAKALRCLELKFTRAAFLLFFIGCAGVCVRVFCSAVWVCAGVCLTVTCSCCWVWGFLLLPAAENKSKLLWHIIFIAQRFGRSFLLPATKRSLPHNSRVCTTIAGRGNSNVIISSQSICICLANVFLTQKVGKWEASTLLEFIFASASITFCLG